MKLRWPFSRSEQPAEQTAWVDQFLSEPGNLIFVRVPSSFIRDSFNLSGLRAAVQNYDEALETVMGPASAARSPEVEKSARVLYGLIHKRFILTDAGLVQIRERYQAGAYGQCPRRGCGRCNMLPIGIHEQPGILTVKLFCPSCQDVFHPSTDALSHVDGAFFGSSLPGMFMLQNTDILPPPPRPQPEPRVYGFRLMTDSKVQVGQIAACDAEES